MMRSELTFTSKAAVLGRIGNGTIDTALPENRSRI
jgi:hypothetical protein